MNKVSCDDGAPEDAIGEAYRRNKLDGIPRHVYEDGRIMKYDWELSSEYDLQGEALEEHIQRLMEAQVDKNDE